MPTASALDELIRDPDFGTQTMARLSGNQSGPIPAEHVDSLSVVVADATQGVEAHISLSEFKRTLCEPTTNIVSPLMLISTILNERYSATRSVAASSILLEKFGSINNLLSKSFDELKGCAELDDEALILLRAVRELLILVLREPIQDRPLLSTNEALHAYLKFTMAHDNVESVKLLFLTRRNTLIKEETHSRGSVGHVSVYPREVLKRVLEIGAGALIIVHNHPSGDASPSVEDINMTRQLRSVLSQIEVSLHDHVIVGASRCYSMSEAGLLR